MNTQLLEQIYYVGELVSVVAVVVSLIYVGIQVRQNTRAVRSSTLQNIAEAQLNVHGLLAGHNALYWADRSFMYSEDFRQFVDEELLARPMHEGWKVPGA